MKARQCYKPHFNADATGATGSVKEENKNATPPRYKSRTGFCFEMRPHVLPCALAVGLIDVAFIL